MNRNLQLLGIARKAGLLAIGGEAASEAAGSGKAAAIIVSSDASEGAIRRAKKESEFCGAAYVAAPYTSAELGAITGRGAPATLAILDAGLAAGFVEGLADYAPDKDSGAEGAGNAQRQSG